MKIGIDLGGSHIGLGVIENETIKEKFEKDFTDEDKAHIVEVIEDYVVTKVRELEERYNIESIGIAIPGSAKDGNILKMVNLGIYNYNIRECLEEKLNKPINVRNDAKCACLAEFNAIVKKDKKDQKFSADALVLATGGRSYPKTGSNGEMLDMIRDMGIETKYFEPSLVPFVCPDKIITDMQGLSLKNVGLTVFCGNIRDSARCCLHISAYPDLLFCQLHHLSGKKTTVRG